MTKPFDVDVPALVEGDTRPIHIQMSMVSGTIEELLGYIRGQLVKSFAMAYDLQQQSQIAFIDTSATGLCDLTPQGDVPIPPPPETPVALTPAEPPTFPETIPAADVPPATTELVPTVDPAAVPPAVPEQVPPSAG